MSQRDFLNVEISDDSLDEGQFDDVEEVFTESGDRRSWGDRVEDVEEMDLADVAAERAAEGTAEDAAEDAAERVAEAPTCRPKYFNRFNLQMPQAENGCKRRIYKLEKKHIYRGISFPFLLRYIGADDRPFTCVEEERDYGRQMVIASSDVFKLQFLQISVILTAQYIQLLL